MAKLPKRIEILPGVSADVSEDKTRRGVVILTGPVTVDGVEINMLDVVPDPGTPKADLAESLDNRIGRGA